MNDLPSTREQAVEEGSKRYFTGVPCFNGHLTDHYTSTGVCVQCSSDYSKKHRSTHRERLNAQALARRAANPERTRENAKRYYEKHHERHQKHALAWREANPDYIREYARKRYLADKQRAKDAAVAWREANPERYREIQKKAREKRKRIKDGLE